MPSSSSRLIAAVAVLSSLAVLSAPLLAKETGEDRPVQSLGGAVHADPFTGVATTSIPIEVPPGRNGMQPSLALTYNSAAGNGWLGMGWDLEQEGIYRQSKWGVNYSTNTGDKAFVVMMAGVSGELVPTPAPAPSTQWSARIEGGFSKIEKLTAGDGQIMWKVTTKQGRKHYFGQTAASRQVDPANGANIFGWLLDRVEDLDGNYMTYTYQPDPNDPTNAQKYLKQIDYAGNMATGASTTNTIRFWLDDGTRPDQADLYATNYRIKTKYRLKTVVIQANGSVVRAYELLYDLSPSISRSRLSSVKAYGKDAGVDANGGITPGTSWPATTFGYSSDTQTFTDGNAWTTGWCSGGVVTSSVDFNGDGKQDLSCYASFAVTPITSSGSGTFSSPGGCTNCGTPQPFFGDFNGDGRTDLFYVKLTFLEMLPQGPFFDVAWNVALASTIGAISSGSTWASLGGAPLNAINAITYVVGDFNGDGKADIGGLSGSTLSLYVSNGAGSLSYVSQFSGCVNGIGDFNGDGKIDLWCRDGAGTISVATSIGSSFTGMGPWIAGWCASGQFGVGDFNGDGKQDLYCHPTDGTTKVALSTGASFVDSGTWATGWCATGQFGVGDFNGDGMLDVYCHPSDGTTQIALSRGSSFVVNATPWFSSWCTAGTFGVGDFNGDGKADVSCFNAGTLSVARSGASLTQSNLLASVSTGLGGATTLTYDTLANDTNNRVLFAVQRVKTISVCDTWNSATSSCSTTPSTTTYSYTGGFYHLGERDIRGVSYTKITSQAAANGDQTISETWFHQGSRVDAVGETETELLADAKASTKGLPYKSRVTDQTGKAYSESTTTYLVDADGVAPYFTPPALTTTKHFNSAGVEVKQTQLEAVSYDSYGNLTLAYNRGDLSTGSDDTTMAMTYAPADTTNWLIGFPTIQRTYAGLGIGGTKLNETLTSYDGASSCTTPAGSATTVTKGHVTKVERWLNGGTNPISGIEYNAVGGVTCTRDPKGNTTTIAYDPTNTFPLTSTNALGHVTTTSYYGVNGVASDTGLYGQAKSVIDPNGKTTTNTYDALGRKLTTTTPDGLIHTMAYNYGGAYTVSTQHVQRTTSGGGLLTNLVSKTYFDGLGRTIKTESPGAADGGGPLKVLVTETQYDIRGLTKQTSLPYIQGSESATGRWRTLTYDALGRLTKSTNPDGTSSQVCYNAWTTTSLDPKLHKKVEAKDAFGRLITVQEYTGTGSATDCSGGTLYATTSYSYDLLGNLLGVTDAKGNVSSMTYDTLGRKLTMHDPDMGNWSYTYDANGNLLTQVDAKNQKLCFSYDVLNRRTQKNYGTTTVACGTNTVVYAYDDTVAANNGKGRLKQVTDPAQSVTFQYDSRGRITQSAKTLDGTTYTTTSAYDGLGRLTTVNYPTSPIKTVTYAYDGPQLKSVQEGATTYVTYGGWNALGQPATSTFGNGVVTTNTYANTNNATCTQQTFRLCTLKTQKGANPLYQDLRYDYEANGNVGNIYDNTVAANAGDQHFAYDDLDRLTLANGPYGASGINATLPYSYDQIGNMTVNPQVGAYSYPTSGPSSVRPHAVSTAGPYPLTYDQNGNLVTMTDPTGFFGYSGSYTAENRLSSLTTTYGGVPTTATFVYDGDGGRVKKTEGTTTTRYISKLYECDNTNCSRFIWAGSTRIATIAVNTGATQYWHGDHLGSSSVITDSTGAKVQTLAYYPFGDLRTNQSVTTPAINVPYKYTGKELDASSNLYFYEARYYHPVFGRFISPDTIVANPRDPQSLNRYSYVGNNPLKYTDPTGHLKIKFKHILRGLGWAFQPMLMQFVDQTTRQYTLPVAAGVIGSFICGPACGGAASGAVSGFLSGRNIGRSAWMGAAGGVASWGAGAAFDMAGFGDHIIARAAIGGIAGGVTQGVLGRGSVWQSALIGGSVGAASAYLQAQGMSASEANQQAQDAKTDIDLNPSLGESDPIIHKTAASAGPYLMQVAARFLGSAVGQEITAALMADAGYLSSNRSTGVIQFEKSGGFSELNRLFDAIAGDLKVTTYQTSQGIVRSVDLSNGTSVNVRGFSSYGTSTLEIFMQDVTVKFRAP